MALVHQQELAIIYNRRNTSMTTHVALPYLSRPPIPQLNDKDNKWTNLLGCMRIL